MFDPCPKPKHPYRSIQSGSAGRTLRANATDMLFQRKQDADVPDLGKTPVLFTDLEEARGLVTSR